MQQIFFRLLVISIVMLTTNNTSNNTFRTNSLHELRIHYAKIQKAWNQKQMSTVHILMSRLKEYPLYPYLEYRQITEDLTNQSIAVINNFIQKNPALPLIKRLRLRFINELARRKDWRGILAFNPQKPIPYDTETQCNYYYAKWIVGQKKEAFTGAKELWLTGKNQPKSCNLLFNVWRSSGRQNLSVYLDRIYLAMNTGNTKLVTTLASQISKDHQAISNAIIQLVNNPNTILTFARTIGVSDFTRKMVIVAFSNIAKNYDIKSALLMIPKLAKAQRFSNIQTQTLRNILAWQLMDNKISKEQTKWRDNTIIHSNSTSLLERRIRMALSTGDHQNLNNWLKHLPIKVQKKDEWQYWKAVLLIEKGHKDDAKIILHSLMKHRGFYQMVAAQLLGEEYTLKIDRVLFNNKSSLLQRPEIARIREMMYWNLDNIACIEWKNLLKTYTSSEKAQLARYACNNCWWNLSVQATIEGKLWDHLEERFPLAYSNLFKHYTFNKVISQSYAMAIARQESAWNPRVRSSVGAIGLMQIMPDTAMHVVKKFNIRGYRNTSQLLDPEINICIGTSYLQYIYQKFDNNRIFASAAYNAGPKRIRSWFKNSTKHIDAIAFIESIPFAETRLYVKNVLSYDAYYRYFMGKKNKLMSDSEWKGYY